MSVLENPEALRMIVVQMIILVLSICVHEFGHAIVADKLGDDLPRRQGRVTLNPMAHADPIGTLALPAFFLFMTGGQSIGFGWGKPVMVNPHSFTRKLRVRTSHMLVAAAGPAMNILFGILISLILLVLVKTEATGNIELLIAVRNAIVMNFILAFFNLIPAPPLDGGTVLAGLLPDRMLPAYRMYAPYGIFVLLLVMFSSKLQMIFVWPAVELWRLWGGLLGLA